MDDSDQAQGLINARFSLDSIQSKEPSVDPSDSELLEGNDESLDDLSLVDGEGGFPEESADVEDDSPEESEPLFEEGEQEEGEQEEDEPRVTKRKAKRLTRDERRNMALLQQQYDRAQALSAQLDNVAEENRYLRKVSKAQGKHVNLTNKNALEVYQNTLIEDLERAEFDGDVRAKIKIQNQLSEINARKVMAESNGSYDDDDDDDDDIGYLGPDYYQEALNPPVDPVFSNWASKNTWIQNPALYAEAEKVSAQLEGRLSLSGREDKIGTLAFYDEVGNAVRKKYNVSFPNKSQARATFAPRNVVSAPSGSSRYSSSGSNRSARPWANVKLDSDQVDFAKHVMGMNEAAAGNPISMEKKLDRMRKGIYDANSAHKKNNYGT